MPRDVLTKQPPSVANDKPAVWDLVAEDMRRRDVMGEAKHGTRLQPCNGRDSLVDEYQEQLDGLVYRRQYIWQRDEAIKLLDQIISETQTVGSEWGLPHVAEMAERAKRLLMGASDAA